MLLARQGRRVLAVDRATFPSDTISTHFMWPRTTAFLARWGLLDALAATGCPPIDTVRIHFGATSLHGQPEAPQPAPAPAAAPPPAPPAAPTHYPIGDNAPPASAPKPLPALDDSDTAAQDALAGLAGPRTLAELFQPRNLIRRLVATVDNLRRGKVSGRLSAFKPVAGRFITAGAGTELSLSPANYDRYTPYVQLARAVDSKQLVAVYAHLYPLFQQAYVDLGYPDGYFNDRLVQVIDHLLATPAAPPGLRLVQPNVLFQYADPELESLSAGQKILLRMGPDNAAMVKNKLREIRVEVSSRVHRP